MKFVVFVAMFVCATAYASAADKSAKDWMEIYKVYMEGPAKIDCESGGQTFTMWNFKEAGKQVSRMDFGAPLNMSTITINNQQTIWYRDAGTAIDLSIISDQMSQDMKPSILNSDTSFSDEELSLSEADFNGQNCVCLKLNLQSKFIENKVELISKITRADAKAKVATTQYFYFDPKTSELVGTRDQNFEGKVLIESRFRNRKVLSEKECKELRIPDGVSVFKPNNLGEFSQLMIKVMTKR